MSNYSELLKHPKWQKKRLEVLARDKWRCQSCSNSLEDGVTFHVHHTKYFPGLKPWEYNKMFLVCLCEYCHAEEEGLKAVDVYSFIADCKMTRSQLCALMDHLRYFIRKDDENNERHPTEILDPVMRLLVPPDEIFDFVRWKRENPIQNIPEED